MDKVESKISKRIELPPDVIRTLTKEAADAGVKLKGYMEDVLVNHSKQSKYSEK